MRILIVADEADKKYWDYYSAGMLDEFDLILSAGDLPPQYLSFLVTMGHCPVVYIHGNHDECYDETPPDGCVCADDKIITINGLRILGLGGCTMYNEGTYQYTEKQMTKRYKRMRFKIRRAGGFDILLTHAPARHCNDEENVTHRGFEIFNEIIEKHKPKYFIHGHVHMSYNYKVPRVDRLFETTVINGFKSYILEIPEP